MRQLIAIEWHLLLPFPNAIIPSWPGWSLSRNFSQLLMHIDLFTREFKDQLHRCLVADPALPLRRSKRLYQFIGRLGQRVMFSAIDLGKGDLVAGIDMRPQSARVLRLLE